jgi:ATP-dependent Clp protease ATP-binding subunit ClpC
LLGIIKTDNSAKEILENLQADLTQIRRKIENMNVNTNPFAEEKDSISLTKLQIMP